MGVIPSSRPCATVESDSDRSSTGHYHDEKGNYVYGVVSLLLGLTALELTS